MSSTMLTFNLAPKFNIPAHLPTNSGAEMRLLVIVFLFVMPTAVPEENRSVGRMMSV